MKRINTRWFFVSVLFLSTFLGGCGGPQKQPRDAAYDLRQPQAFEYPSEVGTGVTEMRFSSHKQTGSFMFDTEAAFAAADVEPFLVERVFANGKLVEDFQVWNKNTYNFERNANGVQDLVVRIFSGWQPNQELTVEVAGHTAAGGAVRLKLVGKAPAEREIGKIRLRRPEPSFPYFHAQCTFLPGSYKPFTIESVTVNGKPAIDHLGLSQPFPDGSYRMTEKYRILKGRHEHYGSAEQIRNITAYDARITDINGFGVYFPYKLKAGEKMEVVVKGTTESGEVQELKIAQKVGWDGVGMLGWENYAAIIVRETAGIDRKEEPVEVTLGLVHHRITDPSREVRVVTWIRGHPKGGHLRYVEVPSQVLDVSVWNDTEVIEAEKDPKTGKIIPQYMPTTTVQLIFLADVQAYQERVFLVCFGNPESQPPSYETDLKVEGEGLRQTISNDFYRIGLSDSGAIETIVVKGEPEVLLEHKVETNGAIHWNPGVYSPPYPWVHVSDWEEPASNIQSGPVMHRIGRYADMPVNKNVAAQVTYRFFRGKPYVLCDTVMEVKEDIFVQALRNGEIVFNHAVLDEFVWKDELGRIQSIDMKAAPMGHILDIPPDTAWIAFISREHGVGFAGIPVEYANFNLYGRLTSEAQPCLYVEKGPWYYWSRGLVFPYGSANFTRMMLVRKGSVYLETNAYLPFRLGSGSDMFAEVEKYQKILTNPLQVTEQMPQDPDTAREPIPELLTQPFFGDFGEKQKDEVETKEALENDK